MKIYIINGVAESGKDTFIKYISEQGLLVRQFSTIDLTKQLLNSSNIYKGEYTSLGWIDISKKTPILRRLLANIKDVLDQDEPRSINYIIEWIEQYQWEDKLVVPDVVFICSRQIEDILRLQKIYRCKSIYVTRNKDFGKRCCETEERFIEAMVDYTNFEYDYFIENNSTLEDLKEKAKQFLVNEKIKINK